MSPSQAQAAILAPVPVLGRYLFFDLAQGPAEAARLRQGLLRLSDLVDGEQVLLGLGPDLVQALGCSVPGLRPMQAIPARGVPSTPHSLCCWLRGSDAGLVLHRSRQLEQALRPSFVLQQVVDVFRHGQGPNGHGRDLTGFEDGTENPQGPDAQAAALVNGEPGLAGSSFMAVQQWQHDLDAFFALPVQAQNHTIGRRLSDNEELEDAPESAHVKRTAQEDFTPAAYLLRRSMPWAQGQQAGLMFVAFGKSLDAFEVLLRRMAGLDDGVVDALFGISKPLSGAFFWCPPMCNGRLDWRWVFPS